MTTQLPKEVILLTTIITSIKPYFVLFFSMAETVSESATEVISNNQSAFNIDWFDVFFQLFITVIGFVFAIWSAKWLDKQKEKKDSRDLKRLLMEELKEVREELSTYNVEMLETQPLKIPMWESVIYTGQLYLVDFRTREVLFRVYNTIKEFNSWALIYTNYYFEKGIKNSLIINALKELQKELLNNQESTSESKIISILVAENKLMEGN